MIKRQFINIYPGSTFRIMFLILACLILCQTQISLANSEFEHDFASEAFGSDFKSDEDYTASKHNGGHTYKQDSSNLDDADEEFNSIEMETTNRYSKDLDSSQQGYDHKRSAYKNEDTTTNNVFNELEDSNNYVHTVKPENKASNAFQNIYVPTSNNILIVHSQPGKHYKCKVSLNLVNKVTLKPEMIHLTPSRKTAEFDDVKMTLEDCYGDNLHYYAKLVIAEKSITSNKVEEFVIIFHGWMMLQNPIFGFIDSNKYEFFLNQIILMEEK